MNYWPKTSTKQPIQMHLSVLQCYIVEVQQTHSQSFVSTQSAFRMNKILIKDNEIIIVCSSMASREWNKCKTDRTNRLQQLRFETDYRYLGSAMQLNLPLPVQLFWKNKGKQEEYHSIMTSTENHIIRRWSRPL